MMPYSQQQAPQPFDEQPYFAEIEWSWKTKVQQSCVFAVLQRKVEQIVPF